MRIFDKHMNYAVCCLGGCIAASVLHADMAHRVKVTILRHESSVRTSLGNRDSYLVKVIPKSGKVFVSRIVDTYPEYSDTPRLDLVKDGEVLSVSLRPAQYCDASATPDGEVQPVRCFQVIHSSWRLPKDATEDHWWK